MKRELESTPAALASIEGLAKTRHYDAAVAGLERFAKDTSSDTLRKTAEARLADYRAYAELFSRLLKAIQKGSLKGLEIKTSGGSETVGDADAETVELKVPGGSAKSAWSVLPFDAYVQLLLGMPQTETDPFTIGLICLDNDRPAQAETLFCKYLAKGKAARARIDEIVASRRGIPVPSGGFVVSNGRLVSADERDKLEKGLVLFRG